MGITNHLSSKQCSDEALEDKVNSETDLSQPVRQAIVPYLRYDGRLIRLVYDVYRQDDNSEIYRLRFNEDLLNNYK